MAQPAPPESHASSTAMPVVAVVGPQYCVPYNVELALVKSVLTLRDGNFEVTDTNGNIVFTVKGSYIRSRRHLLDAAGNPVATFRRKKLSMRDRWLAFRGDSTDPEDQIFTLKRSNFFQRLKTKLDVFLPNNTEENVCDFKIKGSLLERSCKIYAGESETIVAEMKKKHTVGSILIDKDHYNIIVHPNIDYAFIVALIVILDEHNQQGDED